MKKRKTYEVSVINKTYSKTYSDETKFYTSDTALELNFQLKEVEYDFDSAEIILLNVDDRSLVTRPVDKSAEGFTYELEDDIVEHYGEWKGQLKFNEGGEIYVSSPVSFRIENDLTNDRPPQLTEVNTWNNLRAIADKLISDLQIAIEEASQAEINRDQAYEESEENRQVLFQAAEKVRNDQSSESVNGVLNAIEDIKDGNIDLKTVTKVNDLTSQIEGEAISKKPQKGIVTFIFDGANKSVYENALPVFTAKGYKACFSIPIHNALLTNPANAMTYDQMKDLQNNHEWEVISHGYTTRAIADVDRDNAEWELKDSKKILSEHSFNVSQYLARSSNFIAEYQDILQETYDCGYLQSQGGTVVENNVNTFPVNIYNLTRYSMYDKTIEEIKARIDYAELEKGWLVLYEHEVNIGGAYLSTAMLAEILDYISTKDLEVLTGSEALSKVSGKLIGQENVKQLSKDTVAISQKSTGSNLLINAGLNGFGSPPHWTLDWGNISSPTKLVSYIKTGATNTAVFNLQGANTGVNEHFNFYQDVENLYNYGAYFNWAFEASSNKENVKIQAVVTLFNGTEVVKEYSKEFSIYSIYRKYNLPFFNQGSGITKIRVSFRGVQTTTNNPAVFYMRKPQLTEGTEAPIFSIGKEFTERFMFNKTVLQVVAVGATQLQNFNNKVLDDLDRMIGFNTYQVKSVDEVMQVSAQLTYNATQVGETYRIHLMLNGTEYVSSSVQCTKAGDLVVQLVAILPVKGNNTLRIHGSHTASINQTVKEGAGSFFSAHLI